MNDVGQSDSPVVPAKPANKAVGGDAQARTVAESVEERGLAKGNAVGTTRPGRSAGTGVSPGLSRVREVAARDKKARFTALLHHMTPELLQETYRGLNPKASTGVDGVTWSSYGQELETNLQDLLRRVHSGAYRVKPSRRVYIPKADGRQRPLGVASLEDKIVQGALVKVLNAIYEEDFLGFSYGYRPGRGPHDALDALTVALESKQVNWVLDADLADFFTTLDHEWLMKFIEHRIVDPRVHRLIRKCLKAGVIEGGEWSEAEAGTPQGATVSPLLANVYLHYVFDLWADRWRKREARGEVIVVRFADDFIVGFQHRQEAERFRAALAARLSEFGLALQAEKTRLIEFGRLAAQNRAARSQGKPETFDFLGFTHICGRTRRGRYRVKRVTVKKRMRAKLKEVRDQLQRRMHQALPEVGRWLASVVRGHYGYYAVPGNQRAVNGFRQRVTRYWWRALSRRSQRGRVPWQRMYRISDRWLPTARVCHPYPQQRFRARHPRQEPSAVVPLAGICAGGRP